jgi:hypothetical protein
MRPHGRAGRPYRRVARRPDCWTQPAALETHHGPPHDPEGPGLSGRRLTFVADRAGRGELDGVEIEDGKLFIARTPPAVPDVVELRCSWAFVSGHELGVFERAALTEPPGPARPPARKYCPSNDEIVPSSQIAG